MTTVDMKEMIDLVYLWGKFGMGVLCQEFP